MAGTYEELVAQAKARMEPVKAFIASQTAIFVNSVEEDDIKSLANSWREDIWHAIDHLAMVLHFFAVEAKVKCMDRQVSNPSLVLAAFLFMSEETDNFYDVQISETAFSADFTYEWTVDDICLVIEVLLAFEPTMPLDPVDWRALSCIETKINVAKRNGRNVADLPHQEFRRCLVRCSRQVRALTAYALMKFPRSKVQSDRSKTGGKPKTKDVKNCVDFIIKYKQKFNALPSKTEIAKSVGGAKARMLAAADLALKQFASSQ